MARRISINLPSVRSAAAGLAIALVGASVLVALARPLALWVCLTPGLVWSRFLFYQPLSFAFLESSPMGVIFGALILYSIGGALEYSWGPKRLLRFAVGITALSGVATVLLSLVWTQLQLAMFVGGGAMSGALWVAYGLANGPRQISFWGVPVTGNVFALIGAGFVFLNAAFNGVGSVVPDAFALFFTFLAMRGFTPTAWWTRLRSWQLTRSLKKRSARLQVIGGEKRNMPRDSDRFLH